VGDQLSRIKHPATRGKLQEVIKFNGESEENSSRKPSTSFQIFYGGTKATLFPKLEESWQKYFLN
jgi:hypothetical protein